VRRAYPGHPRNWTSSFGGIKDEAYLDLLRRTIIADSAQENVILSGDRARETKDADRFRKRQRPCLAFAPCLRHENHETRPQIILRSRSMRKCGSSGIYNRRNLRRTDWPTRSESAVRFQEESRCHMGRPPELVFSDQAKAFAAIFENGAHSSKPFSPDEFPADENIDNYVLKPLYSFAGHGVEMEPTREKIFALKNPHEWSSAREKSIYAAFVAGRSMVQKSKAEIRMMFCLAGRGPRSHSREQSCPHEPGQNDGRRFQRRQDVGRREYRAGTKSEPRAGWGACASQDIAASRPCQSYNVANSRQMSAYMKAPHSILAGLPWQACGLRRLSIFLAAVRAMAASSRTELCCAFSISNNDSSRCRSRVARILSKR